MRPHGMARTIGLAIVVLVVLGFGLYIASVPTIAGPDESRRVVHPAGFSLVLPPDWDRFVTEADGRGNDAVRALPAKAVGSGGSVSITKLNVPATKEGIAAKSFKPVTFQGRPAYAQTAQNEFARDHSRTLLFERDGVWFELTVRRPLLEPLDSGVWQAYADSFRVEPVRVVPSTRPTTTLSVTP